MAAINEESQGPMTFSRDPAIAVEEIIANLSELGDTRETFDFFIANLLKKIIVGHGEDTVEEFERELDKSKMNSLFRAQHINAMAQQVFGALIGHTGRTFSRLGEEEYVLTNDMKEDRALPMTPQTSGYLFADKWERIVDYATEQLDRYITSLIDNGNEGDEDDIYNSVHDRLIEVSQRYSEREGRVAVDQCMRTMKNPEKKASFRYYLDANMGFRMVMKFRRELSNKKIGEEREDYFIRRIVTDTRLFTALLDHLLLRKKEYFFLMTMLQKTCGRQFISQAWKGFRYSFLPHELVSLATKSSVFQKRGMEYYVDAIIELRKHMDFIEAGQPVVTNA